MFSAFQDALFAILKSIFEKLLFFGSYKGRGQKRNLHLADFIYFIRLNDMGKKTAPIDKSKKGAEKKHTNVHNDFTYNREN